MGPNRSDYYERIMSGAMLVGGNHFPNYFGWAGGCEAAPEHTSNQRIEEEPAFITTVHIFVAICVRLAIYIMSGCELIMSGPSQIASEATSMLSKMPSALQIHCVLHAFR